MFKLSSLKKLCDALPNSYITEPIYHSDFHEKDMPQIVSDIYDANENYIGCINWRDNKIEISQKYEYCQEVCQALDLAQPTITKSHLTEN